MGGYVRFAEGKKGMTGNRPRVRSTADVGTTPPIVGRPYASDGRWCNHRHGPVWHGCRNL